MLPIRDNRSPVPKLAPKPVQEPAQELTIALLRNDEFGREVVRLMNERFKGYKNVELDISGIEPYEPIGYSNSYRLGAMAPIARELRPGTWPIMPAVLERALRKGELPDADTTLKELGLVVYSLKEPNSRLARDLVDSAEERGIVIEFPLVFYNFETEKVRFPNSLRYHGGLRFVVGEYGIAYHQPILRGYKRYQAYAFDRNDVELIRSGFPSDLDIELDQGTQNQCLVLRIVKSGLRRLYRGKTTSSGHVQNDINAYKPSLSGTSGQIRIIFQVAGTPKELERIVTQELEAEKLRKMRRIEEKFAKALAHVRKRS